jgi:hypothetical protein
MWLKGVGAFVSQHNSIRESQAFVGSELCIRGIDLRHQQLLCAENTKLRKDITTDVMQQVTELIDKKLDERFKSHEENVMKQIRDLSNRLNLIETEVGGSRAEGNAPKRARSAPVRATPLKPSAILCGFPKNSRKKELETFVKGELTKLPRWSSVDAFAPSVKSSVVIVKLSAQDEIHKFIADWKHLNATFKDQVIRARHDKPPEKRKSDSRVYMMNEYLTQKHGDTEFDMDLKKGCICLGDEKFVEWCIDGEVFSWNDTHVTRVGVDKAAAERHASQ